MIKPKSQVQVNIFGGIIEMLESFPTGLHTGSANSVRETCLTSAPQEAFVIIM